MLLIPSQPSINLAVIVGVIVAIFLVGLVLMPWFPQWSLIFMIGAMSILGIATAFSHFGDEEEDMQNPR